jgi:hypothetical protein
VNVRQLSEHRPISLHLHMQEPAFSIEGKD